MKPDEPERGHPSCNSHAVRRRYSVGMFRSAFGLGYLLVVLGGCAATATRAPSLRAPSRAVAPSAALVAARTVSAPPAPARVVSPAQSAVPLASERVRAALEGAAAVPADEAAWFPFRVLSIVARASGELPAPTAPSEREGMVVWSLVMPPTAGERDSSVSEALCDAVRRAEPRIACAADTVTVGATERVRLAFGWRRDSRDVTVDLALPLRALSRLDTGVCLLSAERTLRTVELVVRVPDMRALGTSLALLATVPRLSDLILVRAEPMDGPSGRAIRAQLSWPTDRADRSAGDLGSDPWPLRCEDHVTVADGVRRNGSLVPVVLIRGERTRGAVVSLAQREYFVTEGDSLGDAVVVAVTEQGVYVRRGSGRRVRPVFFRFATPPPLVSVPSSRRAPRVPLPPEPPAPSSAP